MVRRLARELGVSDMTVVRWMQGKSKPHPAMARHVFLAFLKVYRAH